MSQQNNARSIKLRATGSDGAASFGRLAAAEDLSNEKKGHLHPNTDGEEYIRKFDHPVSSRRLRWSTNCTIEYRTGFVQDLVNILPMFQISRTTLRFGANLRTAVNGLHRGLQRITKTAKGWR